MTIPLRPVRYGALLFAVLLAGIAFAAPTVADSHSNLSAVVVRSDFAEPDAHLTHNIPDLRLTVGDGEVDCNFLSHYESTGGIIRWGFATSEVIEESAGSLTQYYQRGVVDCQERDGAWRLERRLAWDFLGGGVGDAPDLGVEPDLLSEQPGRPMGPWGQAPAPWTRPGPCPAVRAAGPAASGSISGRRRWSTGPADSSRCSCGCWATPCATASTPMPATRCSRASRRPVP